MGNSLAAEKRSSAGPEEISESDDCEEAGAKGSKELSIKGHWGIKFSAGYPISRKNENRDGAGIFDAAFACE